MSDKQDLNEGLERIEELIRKVDSMLSPDEYRKDTQWYMNMDVRRKMLETNPKCFVSINVPENNPVFLPICNRSAIEDPFFVKLSMKIAKRLRDKGKLGDAETGVILAKLERIYNRLNQDVPKPYSSSQIKRNMTRFMNKIKTQLKSREPEYTSQSSENALKSDEY